MRSLVLATTATLVFLGAACNSSSSTKADSTSTVQGSLSLGSFGTPPTGVDAIDETGQRTHIAPAADGAFRFDLAKGHVYKLVVTGATGEEPIVFPRAGGKLDRTFRISSGASVVSLGLVRHFERVPEGGFVVQSASQNPSNVKTASENVGDGENGECVDGAVKGTGAPCVDDDKNASCENGGEANDGECENGKDKATGLPCTDNDTAGDDGPGVDATQPLAVPTTNAPEDVSGCDDGESNDDGEEADGEGQD
jgi:hypothetical protein